MSEVISYEIVKAPDNFLFGGVISPYFLEIGIFLLLITACLSESLIKEYRKIEF